MKKSWKGCHIYLTAYIFCSRARHNSNVPNLGNFNKTLTFTRAFTIRQSRLHLMIKEYNLVEISLYVATCSIAVQYTMMWVNIVRGMVWIDVFHYNDVIMDTIASQITSLTIVYSTVYSDADQSKNQSSASLAIVGGIHRRQMNSPHKWPVTRKMFPFDDVIMSFVVPGAFLTNAVYLKRGMDRWLRGIVFWEVLFRAWLSNNIS